MTEKLKPCPFCGGEAHVAEYHGTMIPSDYIYFVSCRSINCAGAVQSPGYLAKKKSVAVATWNKRT